MKSILIILSIISSITITTQAKPVGDVRFIANIISFDTKTVKIETAGNKFEIPRSKFTYGKLESGQEREIAMSKNEFDQMKLTKLYQDSKAAAKTK